MLSWLAPLLVLGLVIFVHELGHFLAAKWAGVYAPRFSLGWGKPLWSFRRGETEYCVSWLPIGGYVRMASKEDETASMLEGGNETGGEEEAAQPERSRHWDEHSMIPHGPKPIPSDRWFESKPLYARLVIMLAGVFMNVVLALVVSTGVFAYYGTGYVPAVADSIIADMPAERAGMLAGDSIVSVDGVAVTRFEQVLSQVSAAPEREIAVDVVRNGELVTLMVTPEAQDIPVPPIGETRRVGRIGVGATSNIVRERVPVGQAAVSGWNATWGMSGEVIAVLRGLVGGRVSVDQLGGPIEIVRTSVVVAQTGGLESLWKLIAFLSINLAVLNLLPIPLLDGGQILLQLAQGVRGKEFSPMVREWYARIGLVAILMLFLTVTFNDLKRIVLGFLN